MERKAVVIKDGGRKLGKTTYRKTTDAEIAKQKEKAMTKLDRDTNESVKAKGRKARIDARKKAFARTQAK